MTRRGFTIIELSVVIAIIAILAAILFPVFAKAREKARQASCLSNLFNIGMALRLYAHDNDEQYPPRMNDLQPLCPRYLAMPQVFMCPSDSSQWPMGWQPWPSSGQSGSYPPGPPPGAPPSAPGGPGVPPVGGAPGAGPGVAPGPGGPGSAPGAVAQSPSAPEAWGAGAPPAAPPGVSLPGPGAPPPGGPPAGPPGAAPKGGPYGYPGGAKGGGLKSKGGDEEGGPKGPPGPPGPPPIVPPGAPGPPPSAGAPPGPEKGAPGGPPSGAPGGPPGAPGGAPTQSPPPPPLQPGQTFPPLPPNSAGERRSQASGVFYIQDETRGYHWAPTILTSAYYYYAGLRYNFAPLLPLVADNSARHNDRANILYTDGSLRSIPAAQWLALWQPVAQKSHQGPRQPAASSRPRRNMGGGED